MQLKKIENLYSQYSSERNIAENTRKGLYLLEFDQRFREKFQKRSLK